MKQAIGPRRMLAVGIVALAFASHGGTLRLMHQRDTGPDAALAAGPAADTTVTIRTVDTNLSFTPDRISLEHGTRVTIRYINEGALPHNFVLLKSEDQLDTIGPAAFNASETGYVPLEYKDQFIAYSALAKPGDTVEVTFVVPEPGEYTFVCLYPGHYNMMLGTLRSLR